MTENGKLTMFRQGIIASAILLAASLSSVSAYCPKEWIHNIGFCSFRIECTGSIREVALPDHCNEYTNHKVTVEVILRDAIERFDEHMNKDLLNSVTSFTIYGTWPTTALSFLAHTPNIQKLILTGSQIKHIERAPFYKLKHLNYLDLSRNYLENIEKLFEFKDEQNNLRTLLLSNNYIKNVYGDDLADLTDLKELDLSYNLISDLDDEPFYNMTNLEILRLNNNKIKDLNGALNTLTNLKHLYLSGNFIQSIDEPSLTILYQLETLDVSKNQLEKLKPVMFSRNWAHFNGMCKIILSDNDITTIPNAAKDESTSRVIRELGKPVEVLTELDLSKNKITKIEFDAFQSIVKMISLDLSKNKLTDFIVNAEGLKDVTYLNLSSNFITNLYFESFSSMTNLQNLDLSHNHLSYIPDETFTNNYNLKFVNVTHNVIHVLKNLRINIFHSDGGVLDLSNNGLSKLGATSREALRLTILVLNSNSITDTAHIDLTYQNELKTLEMKMNNIKHLNDKSLLLPLSLTSLDLSYNQIQDIGPSTFHRVSHLKSLFLGHNKLRTVQYGAFQSLTSLTSLDLSFNSIKTLDSKVMMDLKSLSVLSLKFNGLYSLDYQVWLAHKDNLQVYLDGNPLTCGWLGEALKDFNNGLSKMRPTVQFYRKLPSGGSLEGVPCIENLIRNGRRSGQIQMSSSFNHVLADERLLIINRKILEAVKDQTYFMKSFMNQMQLKSYDANYNLIAQLMQELRADKYRRLNDVVQK